MLAPPISRDALMQVVKTLPSAPQVLAQLGRLLLDMDSDLTDLIELIRKERALADRIIRIANSPAYNTGRPFTSLDEALICVGFTQIYRLTGFAAAAQLADQQLDFYGVTGQQLRENAVFTALVMEAFARPAKLDPRLAYTAGLLRPLGRLALDRIAKRMETPPTVFADKEDGAGLLEWEQSFAGMGNCEVSSIVLGEWRFPSAMVFAVRDHYLLEPTTASPLARLLNLAAGAADRSGYGLPGEVRFWEVTPEKQTESPLDETQIADALDRATENFQAVRSIVR